MAPNGHALTHCLQPVQLLFSGLFKFLAYIEHAQQVDDSPADFQAVFLVISGPDYRVERFDHRLEGPRLKVAEQQTVLELSFGDSGQLESSPFFRASSRKKLSSLLMGIPHIFELHLSWPGHFRFCRNR